MESQEKLFHEKFPQLIPTSFHTVLKTTDILIKVVFSTLKPVNR